MMYPGVSIEYFAEVCNRLHEQAKEKVYIDNFTYKDFCNWCNDRACDGCWGAREALICIEICNSINKQFFWRREKCWRDVYRDSIVEDIVIPINKKIDETYKVKGE